SDPAVVREERAVGLPSVASRHPAVAVSLTGLPLLGCRPLPAEAHPVGTDLVARRTPAPVQAGVTGSTLARVGVTATRGNPQRGDGAPPVRHGTDHSFEALGARRRGGAEVEAPTAGSLEDAASHWPSRQRGEQLV